MRGTRSPEGGLLRHRAVQRVAAAGLCLVLVALTALTAVSLAAAVLGARTSEQAAHASAANDLYHQARFALATLEVRRHEVMLEPVGQRQEDFRAARGSFGAALDAVAEHDEDPALVRELRERVAAYDGATAALFTRLPTDRDYDDRALEADVDRLVDRLDHVVEEHRAEAARRLAVFDRTEHVAVRVVTAAFALGVVLLGVCAAALRAHGRHADEAARRTTHQALHDAVTGLPNRVLLAERLERALDEARDGRHRCALLLLDLDRFKEVNDTFGHHYGDVLLAQVGPRVAQALPGLRASSQHP